MNIINKMLDTQNEVNVLTRGDTWATQGLDWRLAISQETAELIDSVDWKWWKHMKVDLDNAKIEIVDIWHFTLSLMLEEAIIVDEIMMDKFDALTKTGEVSVAQNRDEIIKHFKNINKVAANDKLSLEIADAVLMAAGKIGMSLEDVTKLYFGKAVLNRFRQMHGYAEGTYKKDWDGYEDNEIMFDMVGNMGYNDTFEVDLLSSLTERYMLVE